MISVLFFSYVSYAQSASSEGVTRTYTELKASLPKTITENVLSPAGTTVYEIRVDTNTNVLQARISLNKVDIALSDIGVSPGGIVFGYFNVTGKNIEDSDLDELSLKFRVDRSWLDSNGVPEGGVKLLMLSSGQWNEVETSVLLSDTDSVSYKSYPDKFATFAIAGESPAVVQAPVEETETPEESVVDVASSESTASDRIQNDINWTIIGAVAVVAVLVLVFLPGSILRKKNGNPWKAPMR